MSFSSSIYPFRVKVFPNKLAPNVPNNILRNTRYPSTLTRSCNKLESSRDSTISIIFFISSFGIISIALLCEAEDEGRPDIFDFFLL